MAHVATPGMAVTYIRSTGEHVSATIIGPSTRGDDFFHVKYIRNGHELYFTKDIVDDGFVPRNRKPKRIPKPEAKPAPKAAPKGKHVQLFKMRRKVGKDFYSTAPDGPDGQ